MPNCKSQVLTLDFSTLYISNRLNQGKKISCKCMAWVAAGEAIYPFPGVCRESGNWNWSLAPCPGDITCVSLAHVVLSTVVLTCGISGVWAFTGGCSRGNFAFWALTGDCGHTGGCAGVSKGELCVVLDSGEKILLSSENLLKGNFFLLPLVLV